jgi:UDP-N-acetylglucosamine--N-acetylmuramyl-(pentapeptide) pyrophosphoryl-undecaprenol N-acetylglucosamine transferase
LEGATIKRIILTGGGTAGHVMPHLAIIPPLKEEGWDIQYIGTEQGIERGLMEPHVSKYHAISTGKLRRYFDLRNLSDPFRVIKGMAQSMSILKKEKPDIVFSKGGFVSVPVAYAAAIRRIPVILHESDMTSGLANRLCAPFASVICTTFPETAQTIGKKAVACGTPLRSSLFEGDKMRARGEYGFSGEKPVLMITGGSSGAQAVNDLLRGALDLLKAFDVLHLCGKGNLDASLKSRRGYVQREFIDMADAYALADLVISRAGSNTICELLALAKPNLLIPYPAAASRGDQIDNARSFEKRGFSKVLMQEDATPKILADMVISLYNSRERYIAAMKSEPLADGSAILLNQIRKYAK